MNTAYPSFEDVIAALESFSEHDSGMADLKTEGQSFQGRPVVSLTLTDSAYPANEKQTVLLSAVHAGGERSATAAIFAVIQWLLSEDAVAAEVLRRQVVVCMPIVHPDGYVEGRLGDQGARHTILNTGWNLSGVVDAEAVPEAVALQGVIDRLQPDLYADVHGISLDFEGQLMLESSAASPSRMTGRPFHRQIAQLMDDAALVGGFPSDRQEEDRELAAGELSGEALGTKLRSGCDAWLPGTYAYVNYHTLQVVMEVTWQESGLLRLQRLLQIGNERWEGELVPGYPNQHCQAAEWLRQRYVEFASP